jgi:Ca2+-binding RTX toxin-like protein
VVRSVTLFDGERRDRSIDARYGADDRLESGDGADLLFGQRGQDALVGGAGDDYMEGNAGDDSMRGEAGADDMIGGSSSADGRIGSGASVRMASDGDDRLAGGDTDDVLLGDNGTIRRPTGSDGRWQRRNQAAMSLIVRTINPATKAHTSAYGDDSLDGGAGHDRLFGQDGNNEAVNGE